MWTISGSTPSTVLYSARTLGTVPAYQNTFTARSYTSLTLPGHFTLAANTNYAVTVSPQTTATSAVLSVLQFSAAPTSATGLTTISAQYQSVAPSWTTGGTNYAGFRLSDDVGVAFTYNQTWYESQAVGNTACISTAVCSRMPATGATAPAANVAFTSGVTNLAIGFTVPYDGLPVNFGLSGIGLALWGGSGGFSSVTATASLYAGVVGTGTTQGSVAPSGAPIATSSAPVPNCLANAGTFFTLYTE